MCESATNVLDLNTELLPLILVGMTHAEQARAGCACTALHAAVAEAWAAARTADACSLGLAQSIRSRLALYTDSNTPVSSLRAVEGGANHQRAKLIIGQDEQDHVPRHLAGALRPLSGLRELSLKGLRGCVDSILSGIIAPNLPQLSMLDLRETAVATRGVNSLKRLQLLTSLDLTFCPLVSYAAVIALREASPRQLLIRRQPAWLDGHYETPWGETHTYYPCGAFEFMRGTQAKGWVAQIRQHGGARHELVNCVCKVDEDDEDTEEAVVTTHLESRLLFLDMDTEANNGYLGVCTCPQGNGRVLVVQSRRTPEPPRAQLHAMRSGYGLPEVGQTVTFGVHMLSSMHVRPLEEGIIGPPPALAAELREFCARRSPEGHAVRSRAERAAFLSCNTDGSGSRVGFLNPLEQQLDWAARHQLAVEDEMVL